MTALTSSPDKADEARSLGAYRGVSSSNKDEISAIAGPLDLIVTTNAPLDGDAIIATLGPKKISGSPTGSPTAVAGMLDFCARHGIEPVVEMFPMSQVNEALDRLREGEVHYRAVLKNDYLA
ncbi:hypothetical protein [Malikia spinosa]|uniref:Alcohol dehydrogenase-like C-terminal domain-containing protein n=1 Tax=Malikia spinosa TaxID=86180 RepID=A0A7C9J7C7_9BURK|nr:hypothetical protein [Malikia spinosa]MYZ52708.1 hypothetical protein [Malikia spinosa]